MSISNRFLGGKAFGFLLSSKKTRFDPNSIDLLLSKDKIERGAVVTSSLLCDFRSAWHGAKLGKNGKAQRSSKWTKWRRPSKQFEMGPRWFTSMVRVYDRGPFVQSHASGCALALPASGPARRASLLGGLGGGPRGGMGGAWAHGRGRPRRRARCGEREREPLARSRASGCALALPASGPARVRAPRACVAPLNRTDPGWGVLHRRS